MSIADVALPKRKGFELDLDLGPFPDEAAAVASLVAQGLTVDAEAVGFPSGRWWITQGRQRAVKCGDCWTSTWSATGFCRAHLAARGFTVPSAVPPRRA